MPSAEGQEAESYVGDLGRRRRLVDGKRRTERGDAVVARGFDPDEILAGHEPSRHGDDVRAGVLDLARKQFDESAKDVEPELRAVEPDVDFRYGALELPCDRLLRATLPRVVVGRHLVVVRVVVVAEHLHSGGARRHPRCARRESRLGPGDQGRGVAAAAVPRATVERRACSPVSDRATHAYSIEKSGRRG